MIVNEMRLNLHNSAGVAAAALLPFMLAGCASSKSGGVAPFLSDDMDSVWQNAGATPTPTNTAAATPASPALLPPANTLVPTVTTVGGPVSTKPAYAQYDSGWPRTFASVNSTNT